MSLRHKSVVCSEKTLLVLNKKLLRILYTKHNGPTLGRNTEQNKIKLIFQNLKNNNLQKS